MSTRDRIQPTSRRGVRAWLIATGGLALLAATTAPSLSEAALPLGPRAVKAPLNLAPAITPRAFFDAREDLKAAYNKALGQYNNLELDPAKAGLESALSGAAADDPLTAPLRMLKAVIIFSNTGKADETTAAFTDAVKADYNVSLPTELRSPDLQKLLDKARANSGMTAPSESVRHTAPDLSDACGKDVVLTAVANQAPEGGQVVLYWRQGSSGEFKTVTMDTFGNVAQSTLTASDHGDKPVEYFFYVFDSANKDLGNKGDQEAPLKLDLQCKKEEAPKPKAEPPPEPKSTLPRFFINIGLGTGAGIARGVADQSYKQLSPSSGYTPADFACSLARWQAGAGALPNAIGFQNGLSGLPAGSIAPYTAAELATNYNPETCGEHHPVKSGMASAPFHIAPEFGFRIGKSLVLSLFGRLEVVTGSKVYRDNPKLALSESYTNEVLNPNPQGVRTKPGFTGAGGVKIKYFLGKDTKKFRLFVGGQLGGGFSRLRVPMGFANDRNGNSVPDDKELPASLNLGQCQPVWPYSGGCAGGDAQLQANALANSVATTADKSQRIDTVRIGGGFIGANFGFHYQIVKNFALFGEIQANVWFPKTTSFLLDFALGPVITF
ncbi:MAG: hypothetical protein JNK56_38470 [Myxococcales bacterium]|nr:hypothetical protein [Myxococcales bacterium]